MQRAIEPNDQQLREACARMSQRFRWLGSFESVMQDPVRSRLVRVAAMHPTAAAVPTRRTVATATARPPRREPGPLPLFDRKRAAAGDRDDD